VRLLIAFNRDFETELMVLRYSLGVSELCLHCDEKVVGRENLLVLWDKTEAPLHSDNGAVSGKKACYSSFKGMNSV